MEPAEPNQLLGALRRSGTMTQAELARSPAWLPLPCPTSSAMGAGGLGDARRDVQYRLRVMALAVAAAAQWVANFIISTTFPPLSEVGLGLAYGIYTAFALLAVLFVLRFVRETKGMELEEMV